MKFGTGRNCDEQGLQGSSVLGIAIRVLDMRSGIMGKNTANSGKVGVAYRVMSVLRGLPRLCAGPAIVVRFFNSASELGTPRAAHADLVCDVASWRS